MRIVKHVCNFFKSWNISLSLKYVNDVASPGYNQSRMIHYYTNILYTNGLLLTINNKNKPGIQESRKN